MRRGSTLPLLVLLLAALSLLFLEKEKESGTSLKRRRRNTLNHVRPNVTRVRRSTRERGALLHLLLFHLLQFLQTLLLLFRDIGLWASVTPVTLQIMKHPVHRLQSVRPDTVDHWSILLNHTLLELRSELEHRSASLEPDNVLMFLVHHGGITAHIVQLFPFDMLTQVNAFRLRGSGILVSGAVLALTTLSFRDFIVVPPLVQEGRRRSHIRKGNTSTSSPSYHHSSFSSFRERERKWYKSKEETH